MFSFAFISGALAVVLGAFAAHGLKEKLSPELLKTFETAVRYQFYHTFAMVIAAFLLAKTSHHWPLYAGYCFGAGIILFCGSLYILSTQGITNLPPMRWLGPLTPVGGLFFILGWVALLISVLKK